MNLDKEIQLFEEWCDIFGLPIEEVDGEYNDPRTAIAFLAWYEVVSRKWYKLVPVSRHKVWLIKLCAIPQKHLVRIIGTTVNLLAIIKLLHVTKP